MFIINKPIAQITSSDFQWLIDNQVPEGKHVDFKKETYGGKPEDKKEFLKDISSFANTDGGDLIIGMEAEKGTGVARKICAINVNPDEEILRLEGIARTGLDPRIPTPEIREFDVNGTGYIFIVRIRKSWFSPHRVALGDSSRFYGRTSKGVYPLDTGELRNAFTLSETIIERIRIFRSERIIALYANQTPIPFKEGAKAILHIIPANSFNASQRYDVMSVYNTSSMLELMDSYGNNRRTNLDGVLWYSHDTTSTTSDYSQIYHNGIIETVNHSLLEPRPLNAQGRPELGIHGSTFESKLFQCISANLRSYTGIGIEPPVYIFLTLTGVKGYETIYGTHWQRARNSYPIDRDILVFPEILVEDFSVSIPTFMRPIIDQFWNASGFMGSPHYDQNGNWNSSHRE